MNTSLKINVAGESLQSQFLGLPTRRMLVISLTKFVNNLQLERKKKRSVRFWSSKFMSCL